MYAVLGTTDRLISFFAETVLPSVLLICNAYFTALNQEFSVLTSSVSGDESSCTIHK
jgi:hypothetical protein